MYTLSAVPLPASDFGTANPETEHPGLPLYSRQRAGWHCVGPLRLARPRNRQTVSPSTAELPISTRYLIALLLTGSIGCEHPDPFTGATEPPRGPFSQLLPRRLTFSHGDDRTPSWLPDGSAIIYSSEREDRLDHDRCLTLIPAEGGTILDQFCPTDPVQSDSTNLYDAPAVSPGGRLFMHQVVSWIGQQKLGEAFLSVGPIDDPIAAENITRLPYTASNGKIHSSVRSPAWIGPNSVVYLAEMLFFQGSTFYPDTFVTGLDIVRLDLGGPAPVFEVIPGTDYASSVAVTDEPQVIYYTLGGDSRIYRRDLSSGAVTVFYDFGPGEIARDVAIAGTRIVAVVGGSVLYQFEFPHNGFVQRDEGGDLHFVDLATGTHSVVEGDSVLFRHPVISPDRRRVVAEVSPFAPVHVGPDSDFNAPNHRVDLWLFDLP
jgi:hypothetical protein